MDTPTGESVSHTKYEYSRLTHEAHTLIVDVVVEEKEEEERRDASKIIN